MSKPSAELLEALNDYVFDTENPEKSYRLANIYENMGQTASAFTYLLRTAERTPIKTLSYECLIRMGNCFDRQTNRDNSVRGQYKQAIMLMPERPEAYFLLARSHERREQYLDAYTYAELGLKLADIKLPPLRGYTEYPGEYGLKFCKAVASWWWGRPQESRKLMIELADEYHDVMDEPHKTAVGNNIANLGIGPEWITHKHYNRNKHGRLRHRFKGSEHIDTSHGQVYQDLFVLSMLDGKKNGTYLEIGSAGPYYGNNTALLEKQFDWTGVGIDFDPKFVEAYKKERKNDIMHANALHVDYDSILEKIAVDGCVDYLQLDCEPSSVTYEIMTMIPFDKYKFAVITYEHDHYMDMTKTYRNKSRLFLMERGYKLVVSDVSPEGNASFEDWWVHPDLVSQELIDKMTYVNMDAITDIESYMFPVAGVIKDFEWGDIAKNEWFLNTVYNEVFVDKVYERFVKVDEGDVVVDVGASVGPFTHSILDKKPKKVYCLEPDTNLYATALKNIGANENVVLINSGLSDVDGASQLGGLFDPNVIEIQDAPRDVTCTTFKTFIKENKIEQIDFLKTDCEGGEYDIFNEENFEWITKNVKKISGEWHLNNPKQKEQFRKFRDTYLKHFRNYEVEAMDYVDIKWDLWTDTFIDFYYAISIHIDNTVQSLEVQEEIKKKDHWRATKYPTLEITTNIAEKGCVVDCAFCPQRTLSKAYDSTRLLSLDNFKKVIDKLPKEIRITFAGFTEPWLNKHTTDMVLYAHEKGHPVSAFTTGVGMKPDDVYRLKDVPFAGNPNGGFILHLPDQDRIAKHPINANYIKVIETFKEVHGQIANFGTMCMSDTVHEAVAHAFPTSYVPEFWSRAGNLLGEAILKPELDALRNSFKSIHHGDEPRTCGCVEDLYHNVMLPNGDVSLCCMDYSLDEILGNIFTQEYDDIIPVPNSCFDMCRSCENGIKPKTGIPIIVIA